MVMEAFDPLRRDAERISRAMRGNPGNDIEVQRYHGQIVQVGNSPVRMAGFPDWALEYIEFLDGEMPKHRSALMREGVRIYKVTSRRIYFES